ncbi:MAG: UbiX family flavin prenyltransferase [Robiginitomaculum sp.]
MKKLIIGISGASGSLYGIRMLEMLREIDGVETHLIISSAGAMNIDHETDMDVKSVRALADYTYKDNEIWEKIASGSFKTIGMAIAPCSVKTLSAIATGYGATLMARSADVCLKERRRLSLLVRETPLHLGHIRNMAAVTEIGGIIELPVPAFYHGPQTISDIIDETAAKVLDGFGINVGKYQKEWKGL